MKIPVMQSLWVGSKLSLLERLSIASFIHHGHEYHLYTYNNISDVPDGAQLKDANEIIPEKEVFTYYNGSYAGFADWFRWSLLFKKGNYWVDTDVVCMKYFNFESDIIFGLENALLACPAVIKFPKNHQFCIFLENICNNPNTILPYDSWKIKKKKIKKIIFNKGRHDISWGETGGPDGFTKALQHFGLMDMAKPFTFFYPIHNSNWNAIFDETLANDIQLFSNTYSIHLWNEMSRRCKSFDKNAQFPKESLFEQLKRKYL